MTMFSVLSLIISLAIHNYNGVARASSFDLRSSYPSHAWMNEQKTYRLWWKVIPKSVDSPHDMIEFAMEAKTTGWVGMGISPNGQMPNSDVVIGWVTNGKVFVEDRNTMGQNGRSQPKLDRKQHIQVIGGGEVSGWTIIKFRRAISSCDSEDLKIPMGTARVLYAYSSSNVDGPKCDYHGKGLVQKGGRSLNILSTGRPLPPRPHNALGANLFVNRARVEKKRTTYVCQIVRLPKVSKKHHIIEMVPYVMPNNTAIVHHIVVISCPPTSNLTFPKSAMNPHECNTHNMPEVNGCLRGEGIAAWAVGGEAYIFPSNVGLPFGGSSSTLDWVMLQTHYDNPDLLSGVYDSSGFVFHYTPKLREFDSSSMTLGVAVSKQSLFVPTKYPGLSQAVGFVSSKCTASAMAANNIKKVTVIASLLHSHTLGRWLKLRHIRNGIELPPIDHNPGYDFDYQQTVPIFGNVEIQAGDELILECGYESHESQMIYGGPGTDEEMCLVFLYVYPAVSWSYALTGFHKEIYKRYIPVNNSFVRLNGDNIVTHFDPSTPKAKQFYDDLWLERAPRSLMCGGIKGLFTPDEYTGGPVYYPKITRPYVEPTRNHSCIVPLPTDDIRPIGSGPVFLSGLEASCNGHCILGLIVAVCVLVLMVGCGVACLCLNSNKGHRHGFRAVSMSTVSPREEIPVTVGVHDDETR